VVRVSSLTRFFDVGLHGAYASRGARNSAVADVSHLGTLVSVSAEHPPAPTVPATVVALAPVCVELVRGSGLRTRSRQGDGDVVVSLVAAAVAVAVVDVESADLNVVDARERRIGFWVLPIVTACIGGVGVASHVSKHNHVSV
jgi:hypothetical protein